MKIEVELSKATMMRIIAVVVVATATVTVASPFGGAPNVMQAGTPTSAAAVNQNFDAITAYINALDTRISGLEARARGVAAAWVDYIHGVGPIGHNVSSVQQIGSNGWRVNFTTAMPDSRYAAIATTQGATPTAAIRGNAPGSVEVYFQTSALDFSLVVFR